MLMHHLGRRTSEWHLASQHLPERYAKGVQIRTNVRTHSRELFGTGKLWGPNKNPRHRNRGFRMGFGYCLRQPEVDYLHCSSASPLQTNHNVAWLDVPVNEILFVHRGQTSSDLRR